MTRHLSSEPLAQAVETLAAAVGDSAPRCGNVKVVCIDGPAGAGKTTLAGALGARLAAGVVHLDDLYQGWEQNLAALGPRVDAWLLAPWSAQLTGRHLRYDWAAGRFTSWVSVPPAPAVILEGCGSGSHLVRTRASLLIWVEAPADLRLSRGMDRDGEALRQQWVAWQAAEDAHFAAEGTRAAADYLVSHSTAPGEEAP